MEKSPNGEGARHQEITQTTWKEGNEILCALKVGTGAGKKVSKGMIDKEKQSPVTAGTQI